jgi:hypothetical protein
MSINTGVVTYTFWYHKVEVANDICSDSLAYFAMVVELIVSHSVDVNKKGNLYRFEGQ